jgi:hypothetical protein
MTHPAPAGLAIEFPDSEVARIGFDGRTLTIDLPVVAVRGPGHRYLRAVLLQLDEAEILHQERGCIGRLAGGELLADGTALPVCLTPSAHDGRIELRLRFANGSAFVATGRALRLSSADKGGPIEHLHC